MNHQVPIKRLPVVFNEETHLGKLKECKTILELKVLATDVYDRRPPAYFVADIMLRRRIIEMVSSAKYEEVGGSGWGPALVKMVNPELGSALLAWTGDHSKMISGHLNEKKSASKASLEHANSIRGHFLDLPVSHGAELHRRVRKKEWARLSKLKAGEIFTLGFCSWKGPEGCFPSDPRSEYISTLSLPNNSRGRLIGSISVEPWEHEVLTPPGRYRIEYIQNAFALVAEAD